MSTDTSAPLSALQRMQPGDHYCGIYRSDADHKRIIVDFVRLGIERNEKILYLVNLQTAAQLKATLAEAGIDIEALLASGQMTIVAAREAYLSDGIFEPEKMIALVKQSTDAAVDEGYTALRVTGEMTWALAGDPGSERIMEYESMLNDFYATNPKTYAICQYDQRRFDADMLNDVLHTHPSVLLGTEGLDNSRMYYVPTRAFMSPDRANAMLDTRLANLAKNPG